MRRRPYYEIPQSAFLYKETIAETGGSPEEPIRQWAAFELVRAYGFLVCDLVFEPPVKVGSKTYRIDILAKRNGFPWIVIECKEPGFKNTSKGIEQAISYSDSQGIQAEFAVYTNGSEWCVRRKVRERWIEVPDLPWPDVQGAHDRFLRDILDSIDGIAPLIYKLDKPVKDIEAECFLTVLQTLFNGHNLITDIAEENLSHAADDLLRVLSVRDGHEDYKFQKFAAACKGLEAFRLRAGLSRDSYELFPGDALFREFAILRFNLDELVKGNPVIRSGDVLLLRLIIALLDHGEKCLRQKNQFLEIGAPVHHALRDFLNVALSLQFNTEIPDHIDIHEMGDVRAYCSAGWESLLAGIQKRK